MGNPPPHPLIGVEFLIWEFLMLIEQCIIKFGNNKEAAI